ncbi:MAG TPA: tripartite tricarboxylate transporter substrate binding protein [Burkholderiaceae bacterium]|jgi:tripartite-type tricarboxylate transporter receptor subunit TctC
MKRLQHAFIGALITAAAWGAASTATAADAYPSHPIHIVVPTTPGGTADVVTRLLAQKMSDSMGVGIVIDNRPGAGNVIGTEYVARAAPDGYVVLMTYTDHVFNPFMYSHLPFDAVRDFAPIGLVGSVPEVVAVNPALPVKNLQELIALAKRSPGTLNFGSAGNGSSLHLAGEMFKLMAGVDVLHVPYKGTSPAMTALMAGDVQLAFPTAFSAQPPLQAGQVRVLAIAADKRLATMPAVPTAAEAGLPDYQASIWYGMLAPAATPRPVVERLNAELDKALADPEIRKRLGEQGFVLNPGTPDAFQQFIARELDRWGKVIKTAHIKLD